MTATATDPSAQGYIARAEGWLDSKGKVAWIAAMILGFILFWPVGLALLFYMIWRKNMFKSGCGSHRINRRNAFRSSGNTAFDSYKADTLRQLEDEQTAFQDFLNRLRDAKDKAEFDQFMDDRETRARRDRAATDDTDTVEV
jgi:Protein of unknown function (DUF2852)